MTFPHLKIPRRNAHAHLEIANGIIEGIQDAFPHAAALPHHQQLTDLLRRVTQLLDHPILFIAHTILFLTQAIRHTRHWAIMLRNLHLLEPILAKIHATDNEANDTKLDEEEDEEFPDEDEDDEDEFIEDDDEWEDGSILDPDNGKTYDCKIWREGDKLQVRGYIAFFFRTQTWHRVKDKPAQ